VKNVEIGSGDVTCLPQLVLVRIQPALDDVIVHYRWHGDAGTPEWRQQAGFQALGHGGHVAGTVAGTGAVDGLGVALQQPAWLTSIRC